MRIIETWQVIQNKIVMNELLHAAEHALGVCGEKHLNLIGFLLEFPALNPIFTYIKSLIK